MGTIPASLERFLLLRSLRNLEVRVTQQSANCSKLVRFLNNHASEVSKVLTQVRHASLQTGDIVETQNRGGNNPVFSIVLRKSEQCSKLVKMIHLFQHAASLAVWDL